MYRRSCGRIIAVSKDYWHIRVRINFSYKNVNYLGTMFGGSMTSASDPIYVVQLSQILGPKYVAWDKSAHIKFKRPAKEPMYMDFHFTPEEIESFKKTIVEKGETTFQKTLPICNAKEEVFAVVEKEIYLADAKFYKEKVKQRKLETSKK